MSASLPTLPVEALERILLYTFSLDRLSIPSSPPTPVSSTSHLLLVSKGFTELVLPNFYHSITICKRSDWTTFFHPERGIFVVGEEAERRRKWVRELNIGADVYLALKKVEQIIKKGGDPLEIVDYFVPISKVEFPNLSHVCLLEADHEKDEDGDGGRWERSEDRLIKLVRDAVLKGDEGHQPGYQKVDRPIRENLEKKKPAIFEGLLASSPIVSVDLSLSRQFLHSQIWRTSYPNATIILHADEGDFEGPFELDDEGGNWMEDWDWENDEHYFFDPDFEFIHALPPEFSSMYKFMASWDSWCFEKGVVVVGVPETMILKICRVVFQETESEVKSAGMIMGRWVWMEELDDEEIEEEIERGQETEFNLPPVGTYRDPFKF